MTLFTKKTIETERNRKLLATNRANLLATIGLGGCLLVAYLQPNLGMMLAGLFVPFVGLLAGNLALFINGNVKVHQAKGEVASEPTP